VFIIICNQTRTLTNPIRIRRNTNPVRLELS
jgi:hypothetical protein